MPPPMQASLAGLLMSRPPKPGVLGAVVDMGRLLTGTRLLGNVMVTLVHPLPLGIQACTHVLLIGLTRNNERYCQTEVRV